MIEAAAAAAPPGSAVPAFGGTLWGAAGLQPAPCAAWELTTGIVEAGLISAVGAGGMAVAAVPQALTGQPAPLEEARRALAWPCSTAADASFGCGSFVTAEQAQPSTPDPFAQLLYFHEMLQTLPEHQSARQQGSAATFRAPPRLAGVCLLGRAASSSALPAGESSPLPTLLGPLAARDGAATAAATAAAAPAVTGTAAGSVPVGEAFQGGGGSSFLQLPPHGSRSLWDADPDSGGAQQGGAARAAHAGVRRKWKKRIRHRDCLSRTVAKTSQAVEATCMDIEEEEAGLERGRQEELALMQLLDYQQYLVHSVEQQEGGASLHIPPEALKLLREEDVSHSLPLDAILRYPVAGDTGHLGPDGRVNKVPAFSKVLEDWSQIVGALKQLVLDGRESGRTAQPQLQQQEVVGRAGSALLLPKGLSWEREGSFGFNYPSQQQQQEQQRQQRLQTSGTSEPAPAKNAVSAELKRAITTAVQVAAALGRADSEGSVVGGQKAAVAESGGPASPPKVDSLRPRSEVEIHVRRMLVLNRLRGHERATTADGRLVVRHAEGAHIFSEAELEDLAQLLFRMGLLLWQQVLLCPDNIGRLASRRLDVDPEGGDTAGAQSCRHWEAVVASLELEPKQAIEIVQLYREYCEKLQAAKKDRAAAAEAAQQAQAQLESLSLGLGRRTQASLDLQSAAGALAKCTLMEQLPYVVLVYSVYRVLSFPLQRAKLFTCSWPYFPQLDWIATLAARQVGLDADTMRHTVEAPS